MAIIPLITFRDELRARLRQATPGGGIAILALVVALVPVVGVVILRIAAVS